MKRRIPAVLMFLAAANLFAQEKHQIVINEFLASNVSTNADIVDFDDFSDWIELYNREGIDVDLGGYSLTDNPGNPFKWKFPPGTIIPAGGFLLLWADGFNDVPGKPRQRPYAPYDAFITHYFHLNFKLDAAGEFIGLAGPDGALIDSVPYGYQRNDVSRGRQPDGSQYWYYFGEPTPSQPNTTEGVVGTDYAGTPVFSPEAGFFAGSQSVTIEAQPPGGQIRYTLDGGRPTSQSLLYAGAIQISLTTVVRARVFEPGKLPGPVVCATYFINEGNALPVVSITTPPGLLWDATYGIYNHIFRERELPVHFEFFEPGGASGFNIDAGLMLTGQQSIYYPQKSFTVTTGARFGVDVMQYQVFPQRKLNAFTSLYLRNGGLPDNRSTLIRDALLHSLVLNKMDLDCQAYRPAATFLDGQYWGIYTLRDKVNSSYISSLHKVNPIDVDLLEYVAVVEPDVMEGNADNYHAFFNYVSATDLTVMSNYRQLETWMDIDEYINYQIAEIYADNVVWGDQNVRMWRERREGARWRWILFDTDFGFGMPCPMSSGYANNTLRYAASADFGNPFALPLWATLQFRKLLANQEFKTKFIQRFASYLNTVYHPDTVVAAIDRMQQEMSPGMPRHIARWKTGTDTLGSPIPDVATWLTNVGVVKAFARNRPAFQRQHIIDYFALGGITVLNASVVAPGMGQVLINGIERVVGSSRGQFFKGIPARLEAVPGIGYRFVHWNGIDSVHSNPVEIIPTQDSLWISAVFEPVSVSYFPGRISADTSLAVAYSPYYALGNTVVDSGVTLRIGEGVHLLMPEEASIVVHGRLLVDGAQQNPVVIEPNEHARSWGALCFVQATDSSVVKHLQVTGATKGPDFTRDWAAVSGYKSRFCLEDVSVQNSGMPIFAQFGSITIRGCRLRCAISSDLINIKRAGFALTEYNDLMGNGEFDSDGIDYDGVAGGAIRGNRIYNIYGFNSDAIDLGEDAKNILVENNLIYNICDKAVSVGQASTTLIRRNVFANCGMGVGIKDFNSYARIEQNTFYANQLGVASYEKILGRGGAYADIVNCIIANSVQGAIFVDHLSGLGVSYCLSNTDSLPGLHNLRADPLFLNDFRLSAGSPAVNNGSPLLPADPDGSLPDIGAYPLNPQKQDNLLIDEIHYHPTGGESSEFIELVNAGLAAVNLSGYQLTGSISYTFGNVSVASGERIVVAKTSVVYDGHGYKVFPWDAGSLPDDAGSLLLRDGIGDTVDCVNYGSRLFWPSQPDGLGPSLELHRTSLENMVSSSWRSSYAAGGTPGHSSGSVSLSGLSINEILAENDSSYADEGGEYDDWIEIYNKNSLPIDIGGLYVTDNLSSPRKCPIPRNDPHQTTIPARGFLVLWADAQTNQGVRHLNFKLDRSGEQIGLVQDLDVGFSYIDSVTFTAQSADVSYGRYPDGGPAWRTFHPPTPGASNQGTGDVDRKADQVLTFSLSQNYPNPFNPATSIKYQIGESRFVRMVVYDILGREVAVLVNEKKPPGIHSVSFDARGLASGVYFCRLTAGSFARARKMVLVH
jgi:hypothetical protein